MLSTQVDLHVHSTFSDGSGIPEQNLARAERLGLIELGMVDHVRRSTTWVPDYVRRIGAIAETTWVRVTAGVEAKILNTRGDLDLPSDLRGVDRVVASDHQLPTPSGPMTPAQVRRRLSNGRMNDSDVIDLLVTATESVMHRFPGVQLGHLFSILPKLGLSEASVPYESIDALASTAARTGAVLEISERWRCPSILVARVFQKRGARIVLSSDSHSPWDIGRYVYCERVAQQLEAMPVQRQAV